MTKRVLRTRLGEIRVGDAREGLEAMAPGSVDLVVTSPPFALRREKAYGNVPADEYVAWFLPYARAVQRVLKATGSFVVDIGGTWNAGVPTRHPYHLELPLTLCRELGMHLAQDCYWWNPAKLPSPAEWVTRRRIRMKDAVNTVWWLSMTEWPKADNRRVQVAYSASMEALIERGKAGEAVEAERPSGHRLGAGMAADRGGAIPGNLVVAANTSSNDGYQRACRAAGIAAHPARFPPALPAHFVALCTEPGDLVVDPFAGSCTTGEVAERMDRRWICIERDAGYARGGALRFAGDGQAHLPWESGAA